MRVTVKIYYYPVFDKGQLTIDLNEDAKVKDLLEEINSMYGESFKKIQSKNLFNSFGSYFNVFLNGDFLNLPNDLNKILKEGDTFLILHPVSGG